MRLRTLALFFALFTSIIAISSTPTIAQTAPKADGVVSTQELDPVTSWRFTDLRFAMQGDPHVAFVEITFYRESGQPAETRAKAMEGLDYAMLLGAIGTPLAGEAGKTLEEYPLQDRFRDRVSLFLVETQQFSNISASPAEPEPTS